MLATLVRALQHTALLLHPIMPGKARFVWETLRLEPAIEEALLPAEGTLLPAPPRGGSLGPSEPLFPRIER